LLAQRPEAGAELWSEVLRLLSGRKVPALVEKFYRDLEAYVNAAT
jgi:hypothetical protein